VNLSVALNFYPVGVAPSKVGPHHTFLLYNQCDGYHIAFGRWDEEGAFEGFFDFLGESEYRDDFYEAWAGLPDCNDVLFPAFGSRPSRAALALKAIDRAKEPSASSRIAGQEKKETPNGNV